MADDPVLLSVTVSCSPQVWLSQYKSLKPHASVTLGIPPTGLKDTHLDFASEHLRRALYTALKTEIEILADSYEHVAADSLDTDDLLSFCVKEIGDVTQQPSFKVTSQGGVGGKSGGSKGIQNAEGGGVKKSAVVKSAVVKSAKLPTLKGPAVSLD